MSQSTDEQYEYAVAYLDMLERTASYPSREWMLPKMKSLLAKGRPTDDMLSKISAMIEADKALWSYVDKIAPTIKHVN